VFLSDLFPELVHICPSSRIDGPSQKYINLSQTYECRNWEMGEHYNSVLETTVSFLGIHKWEPDICIGFLPPFICSAEGMDLYTQVEIYVHT
jgi:hypothetical protein